MKLFNLTTAVVLARVSDQETRDSTQLCAPLLLVDGNPSLLYALQLPGGYRFSWPQLILLCCVLYFGRSLCRRSDQVPDIEPEEGHSVEAPWQVRICRPGSDGMVRGQSCRAKNSIIQSGSACFRDAWNAVDLYLKDSDDCCFYYNCSSHDATQFKELRRWNRDNTGRLSKTSEDADIP